jgi:hypothetical protein
MLTISDLHNEQELSSFDMRKVVGGYIDYSMHLGATKGEIHEGASGSKSASNTWDIASSRKSPSNTWDIASASVDTGT